MYGDDSLFVITYKSLVEGTWTEKEIVGWGKIYVKVPSAKNN